MMDFIVINSIMKGSSFAVNHIPAKQPMAIKANFTIPNVINLDFMLMESIEPKLRFLYFLIFYPCNLSDTIIQTFLIVVVLIMEC